MLMIIAVRAFRICCCFLLLLLLFLFNLQFAERGFVCLAFFFLCREMHLRALFTYAIRSRTEKEREGEAEKERRKNEGETRRNSNKLHSNANRG